MDNKTPIVSDKTLESTPPIQQTVAISKKSKRIIFLVIGIIFLLFAGGAAGFYLYKNQTPKQIACTMEAKVCPDGSSVGRSGPKCEFSPCPTAKPSPTPTNETIDTSDWKIFTSTMEALTLRYPPNWRVSDSSSGNCGHTKLNGSDCRERFDITSTDGLVTVRFVIHKDQNNDKIGCGIQATCIPEDVISIEPIQTKAGKILLIKTAEKTVHLHLPLSPDTTPKIGTNKFSNYMIDFSLPSKLGGRYTIWMPPPANNTKQSSTTDEYFNSQTARIGIEIIKSITFN